MPKIVDHDERRAKISAAAVQAIDEQGLDRVRLVDVARRAECTTGAVGHYFPDKDAVLSAALEHILSNLERHAPDTATYPTDGDAVTRIINAIYEVLPIDEARRRDWRVWIAFCGRAVSNPALADLHRDAYAKVQRQIADGLQDLGLAEPGTDAEQLATAVFASFDGLGLRATLEPNEWSSDRLHWMLTYQLDPLLRNARNGETFIPNAQAQERTA